MRKLILIIIFALLATAIVYAQTEPVLSKKSKWTMRASFAPENNIFDIHSTIIGEDTVIEGETYSKMIRDNDFYVGAIRETEDHKIYAYYPGENQEILLYDFDWTPGKTIYIPLLNYPGDSIVQAVIGNTIDSILLLDGKYYQYVESFGNGYIIRGIGHTTGFDLWNFSVPNCFCPIDFLCFHIDDELVYRSPYFENCDGISEKIVSGKVTINGEPFEGVEISYYSEYSNVVQGSVFTDEYGYYSIPFNIYLSPRITPIQNGFEFDPPMIAINYIKKDSANNNFAATSTEPIKYTVSGTIKIDEIIPLEDVTILYTDGYIEDSTFTNQYGEYSFEVEENTKIIITPTLNGFSFTPTSDTIIVTEPQNVNFTANTIGIEQIQSTNFGLQIYPNPTSGQIIVKTGRATSPHDDASSLQIYDITGRIVHTQLIVSQRNTNELTIDISHLQSGVYFLKIENEIFKIIKNFVI